MPQDFMNKEFEELLKAIDQTTLTPIVRRALRSETVEVTDWKYRPAHGGAGDRGMGLSSVYRFAGSGRDHGETVLWSLILKALRPPISKDDPSNWNRLKREADIYRSGYLEDLPGSLRAPRCYSIVERPGGELWLWLEEVTDEISPKWPLARYGLAARHLGQFNGSYLVGRPLPSQTWLSKGLLRAGVTQRATSMVQLRSALDHPLVRRRYPADIVDDVFHLWEEREMFLDALDRLPQTFCHGDASRRNLFARGGVDGCDQTVAIDWALAGIGAIGEEIAPLVWATIGFSEVDLTEAQELSEIVFEGYLEGLRDSGWGGDPQVVRLGYAAASALRYVFLMGSGLLDESRHAWMEKVFGHQIWELADYWAKMSRFLLSLADEEREMLNTFR
jgi:hypothetical protein